MSAATRIIQVRATEVVVRAHPEAVESPGLHRPLHKRPLGGDPGWTHHFDELPKVVLRLELRGGVTGLGELYRAHDWPAVDAIADRLLGSDVARLCRQDLPIGRTREYDGFEIAIWDAYARHLGVRVADLLGVPVRDRVEVSAWSSHRTVAEIGTVARRYQQAGYTTIKLKCSLEDDVPAWCTQIAEHAPGMQVVLDPNERFQRLADARRIAEAVRGIGNVSFNAGLADFQRLEHVADAAGLPCWHGSEVGLGILEAAHVHSCAAARSCIWASDIFGRLIRSHDLLRKPLELRPPFVVLPEGTGLGVEVDDDALTGFRVSEREY